jgi:hypothetical protein
LGSFSTCHTREREREREEVREKGGGRGYRVRMVDGDTVNLCTHQKKRKTDRHTNNNNITKTTKINTQEGNTYKINVAIPKRPRAQAA